MTADLFHVTVWQSVEDIFADGLRGDVGVRAEQKLDEADRPGPMDPEPVERQADRRAEELIQEARYAADVPEAWPRHTDGVFFWPTESRAHRVAQDDFAVSDPIVAVDSSKLAEGCQCLIAPVDELDAVFARLYDAAADKDHLGPDERDELVETLESWWAEVEPYTGQAHHDHEVWCGCSVPPEAIEWIQDPERGARLYEPPDDPDQQRFIDLF